MTEQKTADHRAIHILIAEDNDMSRELMANILESAGHKVFHAIDGDTAIAAIRKNAIDLAFVDINMAPKGGFEFIKYLVANEIKLPIVIVTADDSSDILMRANALGVHQVIHKPVDPNRLVAVTKRMIERHKLVTRPLTTSTHYTNLSAEALMEKAIALADQNAKSGKGGPFGAIVADAEGKILGEGVSGITSRVDPTAHAEVMAIRYAAEKLGKADLSECILYCSSEPTMMGQALIISVGIKKVYYALSHQDIRDIRTKEEAVRSAFENRSAPQVEYFRMGEDSAAMMFESWKNLDNKISE